MVFYFSGTGNSEYVAITIANFLGLEKRFIPEINPKELIACESRIIFVFPVYAWGVPPLIKNFVDSISQEFWESVKEKNYLVDCILVCGDETGMAPEMMKKILLKKDININSIWSVIMPNNYVLLPGFDVDSKELETKKLENCKSRILEIAESLQRCSRRLDVTRGSIPRIKTGLVFPFFRRWGIFPKKWHSSISCIGCGKCASACSFNNIEMNNDRPRWGSRCCSCLACYHICPVHAVEYSSATTKKGQYIFPLKKILSRNYRR